MADFKISLSILLDLSLMGYRTKLKAMNPKRNRVRILFAAVPLDALPLEIQVVKDGKAVARWVRGCVGI